jgi:hypothetical protein
MQFIALDARNEDELEGLLPQIQHADADALIQSTEVLFLSNRSKIAEAVAKAKMPVVFPWPDHHDSSRWPLQSAMRLACARARSCSSTCCWRAMCAQSTSWVATAGRNPACAHAYRNRRRKRMRRARHKSVLLSFYQSSVASEFRPIHSEGCARRGRSGILSHWLLHGYLFKSAALENVAHADLDL